MGIVLLGVTNRFYSQTATSGMAEARCYIHNISNLGWYSPEAAEPRSVQIRKVMRCFQDPHLAYRQRLDWIEPIVMYLVGAFLGGSVPR